MLAQGRYNLGNATIDLINTVGGGLAAKGGRGSASKNLGTRGTAPEWNAPVEIKSSNVPRNQVTVETGKSDIGKARHDVNVAIKHDAPSRPPMVAATHESPPRPTPPITPAGELNRPTAVRTPRGRDPMTIGEYRRRVQQANEWVMAERARRGEHPTNERGQILGPTPEETAEAARRFGLDENWSRIGNSKMGSPLTNR